MSVFLQDEAGSTEQDGQATTAAFKLDIAAVADAPELKTPNALRLIYLSYSCKVRRVSLLICLIL